LGGERREERGESREEAALPCGGARANIPYGPFRANVPVTFARLSHGDFAARSSAATAQAEEGQQRTSVWRLFGPQRGCASVVCCLVWCVVGWCIHVLANRYQPAYLDQDLKNGKRYEGLGRRAGSYMKCGVDPAVVGC